MTGPRALSPNCGPRRNGLVPQFIVLHYTAMASVEAASTRLCDPAAGVSAHHLIARTGEVIPLVPEELRAWHAGMGEWQGLDDINSRSIGIELDNDGASPFAAPQMDALEALLDGIMARWDIPPAGVIAHSDMAPDRKSDPGPKFDWLRLERLGRAGRRGAGPAVAAATPERFLSLARDRGYTADVSFDATLRAVRLRFRPWATGPLSPADFCALAADEA